MNAYKKMISIKDYKGTYGAVIGDVYGSYYEFKYGPKTPKHLIRLHKSSCFTDDSVLTAAITYPIAEAYCKDIPKEYWVSPKPVCLKTSAIP